MLSFSDLGRSLAGSFFQASLLPYLLCHYFLSFRKNELSETSFHGFQFVLLFVLFTIPAGIISQTTYGSSLADVDWLHGAAELLLSLANILMVAGFLVSRKPTLRYEYLVLASSVLVAFAFAAGPSLGFQSHSYFLSGVGNLSNPQLLPWVSHAEPNNALSIPTWTIHFASVMEYMVAMKLVWDHAAATGNDKWKGLTWGMLPLHASGVCACTYHLFYNAPALHFLVTLQAGLTLLGNVTCAVGAFRIAQSNGWTWEEIKLLQEKPHTAREGSALNTDLAVSPKQDGLMLIAKVLLLSLVLSYVVKYGELGLSLPFHPDSGAALEIIFGASAVPALFFFLQSLARSIQSRTDSSGQVVP